MGRVTTTKEKPESKCGEGVGGGGGEGLETKAEWFNRRETYFSAVCAGQKPGRDTNQALLLCRKIRKFA